MTTSFDIRTSSFGTRIARHSTFEFRHSPLRALRGIAADFGPKHADTFSRDHRPNLRADHALAKP